MADLFGKIMGEAAAIKGIPMPAPPLALMSDDMQGECFRNLSSSRRATQCPLFPPVQHFFTAAGGDPSTLKAPVKAFSVRAPDGILTRSRCPPTASGSRLSA